MEQSRVVFPAGVGVRYRLVYCPTGTVQQDPLATGKEDDAEVSGVDEAGSPQGIHHVRSLRAVAERTDQHDKSAVSSRWHDASHETDVNLVKHLENVLARAAERILRTGDGRVDQEEKREVEGRQRQPVKDQVDEVCT